MLIKLIFFSRLVRYEYLHGYAAVDERVFQKLSATIIPRVQSRVLRVDRHRTSKTNIWFTLSRTELKHGKLHCSE